VDMASKDASRRVYLQACLLRPCWSVSTSHALHEVKQQESFLSWSVENEPPLGAHGECPC
jgi:hypothetical protein